LDNRKDIGIYPLKQFTRVIHGNPNAQGRTAMGSPPPNIIWSSSKETLCKIKSLSIVKKEIWKSAILTLNMPHLSDMFFFFDEIHFIILNT
jgi:hypothetical protein